MRTKRERAEHKERDKGSVREKAASLVRLAADERTPREERVVAALSAAALIQKHNLLENPIDAFFDKNSETVQAASTIFETLTDDRLRDSLKKLKGAFTKRQR